jgi:hypothetical protein
LGFPGEGDDLFFTNERMVDDDNIGWDSSDDEPLEN